MERIESNIDFPDVIDEENYYMLSGYKDGCLVEIMANPIIHIFKHVTIDMRNKCGNRNKIISVPLFV